MPTETACDVPITLADVSNPTTVVGTGSAGSCTEAALRAAAAQGGIITFNCGLSPVSIAITQSITLPTNVATVIDGGGNVTLDAGGRTRHFYFNSPNWVRNTTTVTLQRLTLINGQAPLGEYTPQDPANPKCAYGYETESSGGALYMRDGILHVIDCEFSNNQAALIGPDVGGGALYVVGSKGVVIAHSRFQGNRASNGGAIGMLFANPRIYNCVFQDNTAEGIGQNYGEPGCPGLGHSGQGGAGGLAGAIYFDGKSEAGEVFAICGSVFRNNRCNELGGALFRTPNVAVEDMVIDQCTFDANTAKAGVTFIKDCDLLVRDTLFARNRGSVDIYGRTVVGGIGGLWITESALDLENSTFYDNQPNGLTVNLYSGAQAIVRNATFARSKPSANITAYNSLFVDVSCETSQGADNVQYPKSGTCPADTLYEDPDLADLADNGGPTQTMLPAPGRSINIGTICPATDQRGEPRPADNCDAGAVQR
jgi:hypothetical protein